MVATICPIIATPQDTDSLELSKALGTLHLLGADPYLRTGIQPVGCRPIHHEAGI
jgi:hypothetical protein